MPLPEKIQPVAAKLKAILEVFVDYMVKALKTLRALFFALEDTLLENVAPEKRRVIYLSMVGGFTAVLVIIIIGLVMMGNQSDKNKKPVAESGISGNYLIPPDELFLPNEPDFVPGVMLEREQRLKWTNADAIPFWQDPLKNGEQEWRNLIEKTADEVMESVP
jgi:hypothetical protein